jgi:type VI secretion system secreted protein Hcp
MADEHADDLERMNMRFTAATPSRRSLLKGAGVAAGGLAALGALGTAASPAGATSGPDVPYPGAQSIALFLNLDGQAVPGDNPLTLAENSIECVYYEQKVSQVVNARTGAVTGKRQYEPIVIRKPIDRSTPLLYKGLIDGQSVTAAFKFFRDDPNGTGELQQFFTVDIGSGRIASIDAWSPDNQSEAGRQSGGHPTDEVAFVFKTITWTWTDGGITVTDSVQ